MGGGYVNMYIGTLVDIINEAVDRDEYLKRKMMDDPARRARIERYEQKADPNRAKYNNAFIQKARSDHDRSISQAVSKPTTSRFGKIGGFVNKLRNRF